MFCILEWLNGQISNTLQRVDTESVTILYKPFIYTLLMFHELRQTGLMFSLYKCGFQIKMCF